MHLDVIAVISFLKLISKCYYFLDILIMRYYSWADLFHQSWDEYVSKGKACYCSDTSVKPRLGYSVNLKLTNVLSVFPVHIVSWQDSMPGFCNVFQYYLARARNDWEMVDEIQ